MLKSNIYYSFLPVFYMICLLFFLSRSSKPKAKGALKRSLVVIDSDDEDDQPTVVTQLPIKKVSPVKQK